MSPVFPNFLYFISHTPSAENESCDSKSRIAPIWQRPVGSGAGDRDPQNDKDDGEHIVQATRLRSQTVHVARGSRKLIFLRKSILGPSLAVGPLPEKPVDGRPADLERLGDVRGPCLPPMSGVLCNGDSQCSDAHDPR
jgi:hypothetical protein